MMQSTYEQFRRMLDDVDFEGLNILSAWLCSKYNEERHAALMMIQEAMYLLVARQDGLVIARLELALDHLDHEIKYRERASTVKEVQQPKLGNDPSHRAYAEQLIIQAKASLHCCIGNVALCNSWRDTHDSLATVLTSAIGDEKRHGLTVNEKFQCAKKVAHDLYIRSEHIVRTHCDIDPSLFKLSIDVEREPWAYLVTYGELTAAKRTERTGLINDEGNPMHLS